MNRTPPNLLYLTIYNPTLRPSGPVDGNSEDAEEEAHILFYTSKERAVSKDRMLRQIGLAKALINFAELFNSDDPCDNVHSQSRRMIMVSPEPNFWIHAGVEKAKVSKIPDTKSKAKKGKPTDKGKEKDSVPTFDYEDGSVHDSALRAHILKGYERFKLTHGSFVSILLSLGQQALELQLERFWTVWAWSWNLEEEMEFSEQFGPLIHPCFSTVIPVVDSFSGILSTNSTPVVLSRRHIIPSKRYTDGRHPSALAAHLSSMIPPPVETSDSSDTLNTLTSSIDTIKGKRPSESNKVNDGGGVNFLGIPAINMNVDMKKWNWPGYLTFGKGSNPKPLLDRSSNPIPEKEKEKQDPIPTSQGFGQEPPRVEVEVNSEALEDAMSSGSLSTGVERPIANQSELVDPPSANENFMESSPTALSLNSSNLLEVTPPPSPPPLPELSVTRLHLAPFQDPTNTRRVTINYLIRGELMLALINTQDYTNEPADDVADLQITAERAFSLLDEIDSTIYNADLKSVSDSLPSATKILQTQDQYLISTGHYTHSSHNFSSTSSHLFNAKATFDIDPKITEVFSRGQNPQHWHIARRGLIGSQIPEEKARSEEAVFMQVFRKEASLTDVDNVLAGVVKKSGLVDFPSPTAGST